MLGAIMAMAVLFDSNALPDPAGLVDQLGSSRYASRELAEGELTKLGRTALPALRAAKSSKDAEIRARSTALLAKIENSLLLQATPISLNLVDVPVAEAIAAINRQSGLNVSLLPEERASLETRRVTLRENSPLPFWKAMDALGSAAKLSPVAIGQSAPGVVQGSFFLQDATPAVDGPCSDSGPFRVQLDSIHHQSEIQLGSPRQALTAGVGTGQVDPSFEGSRTASHRTREFFLQLVVAAEPRLSITRNGPIKLTNVVDDRGRSLILPTAQGIFQHSAGYLGMSPSPTFRLRVDLNSLDEPGKQIRVFRGTIPVMVAMRKPDPLDIVLVETGNKTARGEAVALTVLDHRPASKSQPAVIQISIKPLGTPAQPMDLGVGEPLGYRPDSPQQQIEVLNAEKQTLPWFPSATFYNGEETQLTLTVAKRGDAGVPATIRYHSIVKAAAEIPFEFRDIPIP